VGVPIKNDIGEQNCYVNVILHAIYYIKEIRKYFIEEEIKHDMRLNIFSELKVSMQKDVIIILAFNRTISRYFISEFKNS
jgi:hypothetical protein